MHFLRFRRNYGKYSIECIHVLRSDSLSQSAYAEPYFSRVHRVQYEYGYMPIEKGCEF